SCRDVRRPDEPAAGGRDGGRVPGVGPAAHGVAAAGGRSGRRRLGGFDVVVPEPPGGGSAPARTGAMTPDRPSNAGGRGASATLSNPTLTGVSRRLTSCRSTPTASSRPAGRRTVLVAVDDVRAERRDADRDVLGALRP